ETSKGPNVEVEVLTENCRSRSRLVAQQLRRLPVKLVVLLARDELHQPSHDAVALHAFGFGVEVRDDPMTQHGQRDLADVLGADVIAALEQRAGLTGENEILTGARARAPGD